jgi:hypothetical protein
MTIDASPTVLTVTFRRRLAENICGGVILFVTLEMLFLAAWSHTSRHQSEFRCDRAADVCSASGFNIFGGSWNYSFPASAMTRSRIDKSSRGGDPMWVVDRKSAAAYQVGPATGNAAQQQLQAKYAAALQSFIDDATQPTFAAQFDSIGGPSGIVWALLGLVFAFVLFRFYHGWRTRLVLDRTASEVTIIRTPALIPPARKTFPLAHVRGAQGGKGGLLLFSARVPIVSFRLLGDRGSVLFQRRLLGGSQAEAAILEDVRAINEFLMP